jgi:hypothetical protein
MSRRFEVGELNAGGTVYGEYFGSGKLLHCFHLHENDEKS